MKVNTDAVLLAAIVNHTNPASILDIGTGTGVIAMMLAQRFPAAIIDAVEIDEPAFKTSKSNFENSVFSKRITAHSKSFQEFFLDEKLKYDLVVSNPPFFLNSLASENKAKKVARHADKYFFTDLAKIIPQRLNSNGFLTIILPVETAKYAIKLFSEQNLWLQKSTEILSFKYSNPHRLIIELGFEKINPKSDQVIIYDSHKIYTQQYCSLLNDFLTIF